MGWKDKAQKIEVNAKPSWKDKAEPIQVDDSLVKPYAGERAESIEGAESLPSAIGAVGNGLDFLDSPIRAGVSEVIRQGDFELLPKDPLAQTAQNFKALSSGVSAAADQFSQNMDAPLTAPAKAPLYSDIIRREMDTSPKLSVFAPDASKGFGPDLAGFGADLVAPSALAFGLKKASEAPAAADKLKTYLQRVNNSLKNVERQQVAKVMAKMETAAQFKNSKIDPDKVAAVLVDNELTPYAGDPAKILEALTGEKRTNYVEVSPGLSRETVEKKDGLIARKSKGMRDEVYEVARDNNLKTQVPQFALKQKLKQKSILENPTEGRFYSPEEVAKRQEIVDGILKPYEDVLVPGVPLEAAQELPRPAVPPPIPLGPADQIPLPVNEKNVVPPLLPARPQNPGMVFPGQPGSRQVDAVIAPVIPPAPKAPQSYGGIVTKEAQAKYDADFADWEKSKTKIEKQHAKEIADAEALDESIRVGGERTRESMAKDANQKYDSAIKAWEEEVLALQKDYKSELGKARDLDRTLEDAKVKQAAERFIEKAKRNKAYRQEIMEVDDNYGESVIQALKAKAFNQPRHWSLEDMMTLRTNIGKRLSSAEFHADKPLTLEKEVLENIYHSLKEEISGALKGKKVNIKGSAGQNLDAAEYYEIQSNAIRRMMEAQEILKSATLNELKAPDFMAKLMGIVSAGGVGGTMASGAYMMGMEPTIPLGIAGIAGVAETYRQTKAGAPQLMARGAKTARNMLNTAAENPNETIKGLGAATRAIRDQYVMPNPEDEGYVPPQTRVPTQLRNIPLELIKTPLERSSDALVGNKRLVLAKFAQQAPEFFGMVAEAAKDDEQFKKVMGFLANAPRVPGQPSPRDLFVNDKYNTWDGKIMDPQMKMLAMDDTRNNSELDSIQKAKLLNKIQKGESIA